MARARAAGERRGTSRRHARARRARTAAAPRDVATCPAAPACARRASRSLPARASARNARRAPRHAMRRRSHGGVHRRASTRARAARTGRPAAASAPAARAARRIVERATRVVVEQRHERQHLAHRHAQPREVVHAQACRGGAMRGCDRRCARPGPARAAAVSRGALLRSTGKALAVAQRPRQLRIDVEVEHAPARLGGVISSTSKP